MTPDPMTELASDRAALQRSSTAERVAHILRERITDGTLQPGSRLPEDALGSALGVSRNTLREAFRLLIHEHLVVAELNRGAFVRRLSSADVVDLYRVRQLVECAAVRAFTGTDTEAPDDLRRAVQEGELAAKEDRWSDVATANMRFHQAIVALARSPRLDEYMRQVSAELRLAFHVMQNPRTFHEPFLGRNREILERLDAGDLATAADLLAAYLRDAERQVVAGYEAVQTP
ncbi:MAG TPA: GntR family transcriptional regulator [Kineosporiaceae bacterium]|nr:GntR family transcriptional regulator [Kineosporiaceae bacterium]